MKKPVTSMSQAIHLNDLFEPDVMTGFEFSRVYRQKAHYEPEERLMFAVLADAIDCFQRYCDADSKRYRALSNQAEAWMLSNDERSPFSFANICETLNIDPVYLRLGLLRWRADRLTKNAAKKRSKVRLISGRVKSHEIRA